MSACGISPNDSQTALKGQGSMENGNGGGNEAGNDGGLDGPPRHGDGQGGSAGGQGEAGIRGAVREASDPGRGGEIDGKRSGLGGGLPPSRLSGLAAACERLPPLLPSCSVRSMPGWPFWSGCRCSTANCGLLPRSRRATGTCTKCSMVTCLR